MYQASVTLQPDSHPFTWLGASVVKLTIKKTVETKQLNSLSLIFPSISSNLQPKNVVFLNIFLY